jgi:hypothetical protein
MKAGLPVPVCTDTSEDLFPMRGFGRDERKRGDPKALSGAPEKELPCDGGAGYPAQWRCGGGATGTNFRNCAPVLCSGAQGLP